MNSQAAFCFLMPEAGFCFLDKKGNLQRPSIKLQLSDLTKSVRL
ncbi:hypothetical protein Sta7437_4881 (plasmid) [Stanieria cyanosphaera PCC 7437]|uniref:Uncharacterized protein n=1 Tax=Stanieria cyanosphaera (strain ATCC 29371 / PCC 7437) TaxID=111780 RepID=K9Y1V2_STAC7|nr:hypothetical protein [Stanieria cyanosphaera]AFZ38309.1 hypothetical protein Sta7437_4881 [Stanieria cyanosphaera PCC 7437]